MGTTKRRNIALKIENKMFKISKKGNWFDGKIPFLDIIWWECAKGEIDWIGNFCKRCLGSDSHSPKRKEIPTVWKMKKYWKKITKKGNFLFW